MDLAIAELVARPDRARAGLRDHGTVLDGPAGRLAAGALPVLEVLAVEEDDRVRGRRAGVVLGAARAGGHDRGERPVAVVDVPAPAGEHRRVLVANLRPGLLLVLSQAQRRDRQRRRDGHRDEEEAFPRRRRHAAPLGEWPTTPGEAGGRSASLMERAGGRSTRRNPLARVGPWTLANAESIGREIGPPVAARDRSRDDPVPTRNSARSLSQSLHRKAISSYRANDGRRDEGRS